MNPPFLPHDNVLNPQELYYLSSLIQWHAPPSTLRSANQYLLLETKVKTKTYGERGFSFLAPSWHHSLLVESLVRGHSTIRLTNWSVPDYDFFFCVPQILSFCSTSALLGRLFEIKACLKLFIHSFMELATNNSKKRTKIGQIQFTVKETYLFNQCY